MPRNGGEKGDIAPCNRSVVAQLAAISVEGLRQYLLS